MSTTHHGRTKGRWRKIVSYTTRENPNPNSSKVCFDLLLNCGHVVTRIWPRNAQVGKGSECNLIGCTGKPIVPEPVVLEPKPDVTKSDPALLPCPFCNYHNAVIDTWCVFCPNCAAKGPRSMFESRSILLWNTRTIPNPPVT